MLVKAKRRKETYPRPTPLQPFPLPPRLDDRELEIRQSSVLLLEGVPGVEEVLGVVEALGGTTGNVDLMRLSVVALAAAGCVRR